MKSTRISLYFASVETLDHLLATPEVPWSAIVAASQEADFLLGTLSSEELEKVRAGS
jgi:hypothetical protein